MSRRATAHVLVLIFMVAFGLPFSPVSADAREPGKVFRIGYLSPLSRAADSTRSGAFRQGLRDLGYIEGQNITIEWRFAEGRLERLPELAAELVRLKVDVIVAGGGSLIARAAKTATGTIPIVMTNVEDPVATGLVASLARPGGSVTGLTALVRDLSAKRLQLLKEAVPNVSRVAVLWNSAYPEKAREFDETQAAAQAFAIQLQALKIRRPDEIDAALDAAINERAGALITLPDPLTNTHGPRIVAQALKQRLPTMFTQRPPVDAGGLISYGPSYVDLFRRAAGYVDRILKGARPGDLPVEQPTKFELVINLKTAKALGLTIPPSVLLRADEVIH
jgi:putative ABC transport system substrate-binding protein